MHESWIDSRFALCNLLQDSDEANVLPEADVAMVARSVYAFWEMLLHHSSLLLPFLQNTGLRATHLHFARVSASFLCHAISHAV